MAKTKVNLTAQPVDSDAVALMRTFESLKSQLQKLDDSDREAELDMQAAEQTFRAHVDQRNGVRALNARNRRELEAKFYNVRDLLSAVVGRNTGLEDVAMSVTKQALAGALDRPRPR